MRGHTENIHFQDDGHSLLHCDKRGTRATLRCHAVERSVMLQSGLCQGTVCTIYILSVLGAPASISWRPCWFMRLSRLPELCGYSTANSCWWKSAVLPTSLKRAKVKETSPHLMLPVPFSKWENHSIFMKCEMRWGSVSCNNSPWAKQRFKKKMKKRFCGSGQPWWWVSAALYCPGFVSYPSGALVFSLASLGRPGKITTPDRAFPLVFPQFGRMYVDWIKPTSWARSGSCGHDGKTRQCEELRASVS